MFKPKEAEIENWHKNSFHPDFNYHRILSKTQREGHSDCENNCQQESVDLQIIRKHLFEMILLCTKRIIFCRLFSPVDSLAAGNYNNCSEEYKRSFPRGIKKTGKV